MATVPSLLMQRMRTEAQAPKLAECLRRFVTEQSCDKAAETITPTGELEV